MRTWYPVLAGDLLIILWAIAGAGKTRWERKLRGVFRGLPKPVPLLINLAQVFVYTLPVLLAYFVPVLEFGTVCNGLIAFAIIAYEWLFYAVTNVAAQARR